MLQLGWAEKLHENDFRRENAREDMLEWSL
jgi:hypothetical protein